MFGMEFLSYENMAWMAPLCALLALGVAAYLALWVLKQDPGNEKMIEISRATQEGALAFLLAEYRVLAIFVLVVAAILAFATTPLTAVAFITGAVLSVAAGFVGMLIATRANGRTAQGATKGIETALKVAFRSGLTTGLAVAGFGLLGVSVWALILMLNAESLETLQGGTEILTGFLMGVSVAALFARVGGGIYTKAADVGADLVGKVEVGIPEDDPRNPAVIADNVGDNVGDVAGMGADLFESYVGAILAPMILAVTIWGMGLLSGGEWSRDLLFGISIPLMIAAAGVISSVIGLFFVRAKPGANLHAVLNKGTYIAAAIQVVAMFGLFRMWASATGDPSRLWFFGTVIIGLIAGMAIGKITEYYTSDEHKPVKSIAEASDTGAGTNVIAGLGVGMMSTVFPILVIAAAIIGSFLIGQYAGGSAVSGIYGIGLAAIGMLSIIAITIGVDAYGPVADNAGGIAEMAHMDPSVRKVTDALDSVGNTTAAIAKGFAIGSAGLTALSLFVAFRQSLTIFGFDVNMSLEQPWIIAGLFIGGMIPFLFGALTMNAVGRTAFAMIAEVRRQFREIPGIMEGTGKPDYAACVDISTRAALKEMILPGLMAVAAPVVAGLIHLELLAGLLAGALVSGLLLALMMSNAGGAWDNAKKLIESGFGGGKGSEAHKAAVVGDTVGDPFKDTSGPSMNTLIKLMTVVALVFMPLFDKVPWL